MESSLSILALCHLQCPFPFLLLSWLSALVPLQAAHGTRTFFYCSHCTFWNSQFFFFCPINWWFVAQVRSHSWDWSLCSFPWCRILQASVTLTWSVRTHFGLLSCTFRVLDTPYLDHLGTYLNRSQGRFVRQMQKGQVNLVFKKICHNCKWNAALDKNNDSFFSSKVCTGVFYHFGPFHVALRSTLVKQRASLYLL